MEDGFPFIHRTMLVLSEIAANNIVRSAQSDYVKIDDGHTRDTIYSKDAQSRYSKYPEIEWDIRPMTPRHIGLAQV